MPPPGLRLLLDTHAWLWRLLDPDRISSRAEEAIANEGSEVHLSPISTWEALILARKGRLSLVTADQQMHAFDPVATVW